MSLIRLTYFRNPMVVELIECSLYLDFLEKEEQ